jgi:hypothetical protein
MRYIFITSLLFAMGSQAMDVFSIPLGDYETRVSSPTYADDSVGDVVEPELVGEDAEMDPYSSTARVDEIGEKDQNEEEVAEFQLIRDLFY